MAKQQQRPAAVPATQQPRKTAPAATVGQRRESRDNIFTAGSRELIFERKHFIIFGIGLLLVIAGLAAMTGGAQPDANTWDESIIYSPRRITLAPILMVAGFVTVIYGIFAKGTTVAAPAPVAAVEEV
jgi:Protein of unknown function (DUF3098)